MHLRKFFKSKARKIVSCLMSFTLFSLLWVAQAGTALADPFHDSDAATSLTFRVGYSGGTFTPVKVFTDSDFANAKKVSYSYMDSLPSPVMDAATGVPLTDFLSKAGIDFNKVKTFAFYATDVSSGPYKTLTKDVLFAPRYYYPNIMQAWNPGTQSFTDASGNDTTARAVYNAVRVYPMIAISDNWVRGAMSPDFSGQDRSNKYRLMLGQLADDPATITAPNAAKWVYQIDVTLNGTPVTGVSIDKTTDTISVGSTSQLTATVTPSSATEKGVTWSSSNTAVATVSDKGLVKAVSSGTATITATTVDGGYTATCEVTAGSGSGATISSQVDSTTGKSDISPATGGTVSLGSDVSVSIPAGALKGTTKLSVAIQKISSPPDSPDGFSLQGSVFEFTVEDNKSYSFAKPVTLTFAINSTSLKTGETPSVFYYDETSSKWVNLGGSLSGNTIKVTVDHFTKYAVFTANKGTVVQNPVVQNPAAQNPAGQDPQSAFSDVSGHWAEKTIEKMVALGAVNGYNDGSFKPDNTITRAEFATILMKALIKSQGMTLQSGKNFADTKEHWAQEYITSAASYGIVSGYDDDTFRPDELITREQMAAMLVRAINLETGKEEVQFKDGDSISGWARDAVATLTNSGVMTGYSDNTFLPQVHATRAEAVTAISNALE